MTSKFDLIPPFRANNVRKTGKKGRQLLKISRKKVLKKAYTENRQFSVMLLSQRYSHLTDDSSYNKRAKTASESHTVNQGPM